MKEAFNFDQHIKTILDSRTLEPEAEVWNKIEARLDHKKRKRKIKQWSYAVAAILVLGLILPVALDNDDQLIDNTSFVNFNDETNTSIAPIKNETNTQKLKSAVVAVGEPVEFTINSAALGYKVKSNDSESKDKTYLNDAPSTIVNENILEVAIANNESVLNVEVLEKKNPPVDVPQIAQLGYNLDDEIEELLKQAELSIEVDEALKNESMSSSLSEADQLLLEAEESLGQSFRTKVFHFVKNSFKDIKTGVVLNK
jgi:hypothetical protein